MRAIENAIENIDDMLDAIVNTMLWLAHFVMISPFLVIGGTVYQKANGIPSLGKLRRQIKLDIGPPPETTIRREQIASKVKALVETGGWDELSKTLRDQEKDLLSTGLNQFLRNCRQCRALGAGAYDHASGPLPQRDDRRYFAGRTGAS